MAHSTSVLHTALVKASSAAESLVSGIAMDKAVDAIR